MPGLHVRRGTKPVVRHDDRRVTDLDPVRKDIYANRTGISVLVHEAAHARHCQAWLFNGDLHFQLYH